MKRKPSATAWPLSKGQNHSSDTPQDLITQYAAEVKVIFSSRNTDLPWLKEVPGVKNISINGKRIVITGTGPVLALTAVALSQHGIVPADLRVEQPTLEDVFLKLTGHTAEEEENNLKNRKAALSKFKK